MNNYTIDKKTFPLRLYLAVVILLDFHLFYIVKFPSFIERYFGSSNRLWLLGFVGFAFYIIYKGSKFLSTYLENAFYANYIPLAGMIVVVLIIYTQIVYSAQSLNDTLRLCGQYLWYSQVFVYLYLFRSDGGPRRVLGMINKITIVWYLILIAQYFVFQSSGSLIFDLKSSFTSEILVRDQGIRLSLKSIGNFMIVNNYYYWYTSYGNNIKQKVWSLLSFLLGVFCLVFVQQTRGYMLVIAISLIIITLFANDTTTKKMRAGIILIVVAVYIGTSGVLNDFFGSFDLGAQYGGSTLARVNATEYYWKAFLANPVFGGVGLAAEQYYFSLVHGPTALCYVDDVGFLGSLATTGMFSMFFFLVPAFRIFNVARKVMRYDRKLGIYIYTIFAYLMFSCGSLIIINQQRFVLFPLLISIVEFLNVEVANDNQTQEIV